MWRQLKFILLISLFGVAILVGTFEPWRQRRSHPPQGQIASPSYVGDASCRDCHQTIFDSYKRTAMGRAWYVPDPASIIEDYAENNHVYDQKRDLHYEMIARDGRFFQREYRLDELGAVIHELERQASFVVGSGEHVRSYVADTNGYLTQLPISWYSDEKKWGLSPGYVQFNHRFDRPIGPACIACHNDYPKVVPATLNRYESPVPSGIGCERCHGPAEWHVREQTENWIPPRPSTAFATITNPAKLEGAARDDVCFQCHLQGDAEFVNPGMDQFGFQPGQRLADFRSVYLAEASDPDKFGIASHATRMVQSRCYAESDGRFGCITCHDPHVPIREVPSSTYRDACYRCHRQASCNRPPDDSAAHRQDDCVACHMPSGQPADVQHTVFTDHWIRRPGQIRRESVSTTDATKPVILRPFGDERNPDNERLGLANIAYAFARGGRANLDEGMILLQKAAARGELHIEGWRKLGLAALARRDAPLAGYSFEQALRLDPNDAGSRMGLGMALSAYGDTTRAIAELETAIRMAPDQVEAYPELSSVYLQRQQPQRALAVLQQCLQRNPHQAAVVAMMGSVQAQVTGSIDEGVDALRRAIQLDPDNAGHRVTLGSAFLAVNDLEAAHEQFALAIRIVPEHVPSLLGLAHVQIRRNEKAKAIECLRLVLRLDPQNPVARNTLRELGDEE